MGESAVPACCPLHQRTFSRSGSEGNAIVGIAGRLIQAIDLRGHALGNGETGCIVLALLMRRLEERRSSEVASEDWELFRLRVAR